jgi:hypothetical protein
MRHDSIEIPHANRHTRRIWYGHGSSRTIADHTPNLPPAAVIDEAIASFERVDAPDKPLPHALVANLSAQLHALDRQRSQLAQLLRNVDSA